MKISGIICKVANFAFIFLNSIVFTSFCLDTSELNDILNFDKEHFLLYDFIIGKIGNRLIFGLIRQFANPVIY
jgi:hypothetical protein